MKKWMLIFFAGIACFLNGKAQSEFGVRFEEGITLDQAVAKAKSEGKYLFLDCYTTWCAPCKKMDRDVYPRTEVGKFMNKHFVALRLQMDTARDDGEDVRQNYKAAHLVMKKYNVNAFPSFIFLDGEGAIVHRGLGFLAAGDFISLAQSAIDSNEQFYILISEFKNRRLAYARMPGLIKGLERNGEKEEAVRIADDYMGNYLLQLDKDSLFARKNIVFLASRTQRTTDKAFYWLYQHTGEVDSTMKIPRFAEQVIEAAIAKTEVAPVVKEWDSLGRKDISRRDWDRLKKMVRTKYTGEYAGRIILNAQIRWNRTNKHWEDMVRYQVKKFDRYGIDTADYQGVVATNNIIYNYIFKYAHSKRIIKKAIGWMQTICDAHPREADFLDTYANLIYKNGDKKRAIVIEEKACSIMDKDSDIKELTSNIEKMKSGQATWPLN